MMEDDYRQELLYAVAEWKSILRKAERVGAVSSSERRELMDHIGRLKQVLYVGGSKPGLGRPGLRRP